MMRQIIGWSLRARVLVLAIAVGFIFFGSAQLRSTRTDTLPEFTPPTVEIQTEALGLSAAEVEQFITVPLETNFLNGVAWADVIRSKSVAGLSSIEIIFAPGTNLFRARQLVQERLAEARPLLPRVSKPPTMLQPLSSTSRVMMVGISSKELSLIEMSVLARWTIKPQLTGVPGVANVAIWGQRERQLQVQVDPQRLRDLGVSLDQVIETTGNALWVSPLSFLEASTPGTGGFIDTANQRLEIQHILPISSAAGLAQVRVDGCTGGVPTAKRHFDAVCPPPPDARAPLLLGDVAQVVEDHQPLIGDAVVRDGPGLLLVIEKFPKANTREVTQGVDGAINKLRPGLSGLEFDTGVYRPASSIERGLDHLALASLIGLALVVVLLAVLFFRWQAAVISLAAIPLSLLAAALVLHLRGETFNVMVLAGLLAALALIIDDVVTDTDNIVRRLRQHRAVGSDKPILDIIWDASLEVRNALLYATLIIVVALAPAFFLQGLSGKFVPPAALSCLLAVLASAAVALTVTPALSLILFSIAPAERRDPPLGRWLQRAYGGALSRTLQIPRLAFFGALAIVVLIGIVAASTLRQPSLLPSFRDNDLLLHLNGPPGASHPEMDRITTDVSTELRSIPGVRNASAHVGRAITGDVVGGMNSGELWVSIDPAAEYDATLAAIRGVVGGYPGLTRSVGSYVDERVKEALSGPTSDITVRVYGDDYDVLRTKAEEVRQLLSHTDGVVDGRVDLAPEEPTIQIQVDLAAAQQQGINPGAVRRAASVLLSGIEVGSLFEQQKVFEVMVMGTPETRRNLTSVRELLIDKPTGDQVRLADVADVRIAPNPSVIEREGVSRRIDVTANVKGRDAGSVRRDVERQLTQVTFPLEYYARVVSPEAKTSQQRLLLLGAVAAVAVFLLLQSAFASWRLAALAFAALPFALVGGVLGALLYGGDITIGSYAGFLVLLGIAAHNVVSLIRHYQGIERPEGEPFGPELVLRGAQERVAAVVMASSATALALAPLALFGDVFGQQIIRPMAAVILGGLLTSTALSLFVVPVLYLRLAPASQPAASEARLRVDDIVQAQPAAGGN